MKILIIDNGNLGLYNGNVYINRYTNEFINNLAKRHEVTLCQFAYPVDINNNIIDSVVKVRIKKLQRFSVKFAGKVLSYVCATLKLSLNIFRYDFIYIFSPGSLSNLVALLCLLFKKDYGIYLRGEIVVNSRIHRLILGNSKFILTVSPILKDNLKKAGFKMAEIILPMIEYDIPDFQKSFHPKKKWQLLFVGRIEERKGIFELLEACRELIRRNFNFHLHLVGGGNLFHSLKNEFTNNEKLKHFFTFYGLVAEREIIEKLYKESDIFILPTYTEGFARVLYDAMRFKLPILTTMVGGIPGYLESKINCIEIFPRDYKSIIDGITFLARDPKKMEAIALNGHIKLKNILSEKERQHDILLDKLLHEYSK